MTFRLIAIDDTACWRADLAAIGKRIFSVYLYDDMERTHCCELTPSRYLRFLENVALEMPNADTPEGEEALDAFRDALMDASGEDTYMHCRVADKLPFTVVNADTIDEAYEHELCNSGADNHVFRCHKAR